MFKENTVFILGAGASKPYGYPLGKELIQEIMSAIDVDSIFVPMTSNMISQYLANANSILAMKFTLGDFIEQMDKLPPNFFDTPARSALMNLYRFGDLDFAEVKLNRIDEFLDLRNALEQFDPVSIDAFINKHHSHSLAGKIMIIYTLLKCENIDSFKFKKSPTNPNELRPDNWYSYLINDILAGCVNPSDIKKNKLDIITFNYDLSLDYCLEKKLTNTEILNDTDAQDHIKKFLVKNIHHVYGSLYDKAITAAYSKHQATKPHQIFTANPNMKRFFTALQSRNKISLIDEERKKKHPYESLLSHANRIVIIGFGFDRDNLSILGFPENNSGYQVFGGKKIQYLDYGGRMNSLASQFNDIGPRYDIHLTRSTATSITDAYQNDFKIFLY